MPAVYKIADNIISSLGFDTDENFRNIVSGISGIRETEKFTLPAGKVHASLVDDTRLEASAYFDPSKYTRLEQLIISSIHNAVDGTGIDMADPETLIILSTVKGNNDLIVPGSPFEPDRIHLWRTAGIIKEHFANPNDPVVISSACISGTLAIIYARRVLISGKYKTVVVAGGDVVTPFILSGFDCLKAIDPDPCRPFDASRKGLSLGEAAGTIVLSGQMPAERDTIIEIASGSSSNDANHISGPSRTGEGLLRSIEKTLGNRSVDEVGFINAHGTGTLFNDEMESIAFSRCGLDNKPVNSLKGYLGHTLGAAGIIESILSCWSIEKNMLIKSYGYSQQGTSVPLNMIIGSAPATVKACLKTSSGFGGTNATILISKYNGYK
ncbi:MAG TPA: beta-ketoacyl synthase N-terminal-like domain-containing protein [Bacteroidales bacterium]|nr:beta-ketoacyl synthase N-terminal-like domain-containing protein [Bacteroidales bacterium]